ncbi:MAG: phosphoenolpyruvate--protein phosphotransferase [Spirochaetaceae bacterium]|jgi:phosphotransferase system enzyme I (PtsI)|nr:phosphoenolpyruvate--protein phosphotransferase [Spirochaetaceae bacterium]
MITLQGKGVSAGIARGRLLFIKRKSLAVEKRPVDDAAKEIERFNAARQEAAGQLDALSKTMVDKIGEENALLFEIHRMMLEDTDYTDPIVEIIKTEKVCAEYAVNTAGSRLAQDFADMDDEYMKARSIDVYDVTKRVIDILTGEGQTIGRDSEPVILAADDFTPSETAQLDRSRVLALVSRQGAANSHTAIFARTMGIPAIIGFGAFLTGDLSGKDAILDGETGLLYVKAEPEIIRELEAKQKRQREEKEALEKLRGKPTHTKNGKPVKLYANIGSVNDADAALAGDAEGVGLFRSEFLYLGRDDYPDEETQYESYRKALEKMGGRQVIIRTLDIGADKQADYFNLPQEENPALGMRAIRICLTRPDLFRTQLRAIYRASVHGNAAIMFPMINSVDELRQAKAAAAEAREELAAKGIPFKEIPIGIMVETPASAVISDLLAREADFFSIGTNDLTQYTLAVDRQNDSIAAFCDVHHEAILRLIRQTCDNAHKAGIWCGICGSLGADLLLTKAFVEMGIDELSVEPSRILKLRSVIAEC